MIVVNGRRRWCGTSWVVGYLCYRLPGFNTGETFVERWRSDPDEEATSHTVRSSPPDIALLWACASRVSRSSHAEPCSSEPIASTLWASFRHRAGIMRAASQSCARAQRSRAITKSSSVHSLLSCRYLHFASIQEGPPAPETTRPRGGLSALMISGMDSRLAVPTLMSQNIASDQHSSRSE